MSTAAKKQKSRDVRKQIKHERNYLNKITWGDWVIAACIGLLTLTMAFPFYNLICQSFSTAAAITKAEGVMFYPESITIENYKYVFMYPNVWTSYKNTLFITFVGTILSLVLTTMGGYALSKRDLPFRSGMTWFIIITMFVSGGLIPGYLNLRRLHLLNTLWVMIIPGCISTNNMFLMRNFFMGIPQDLKDSAYIDGASEVRTMISIVLPLSGAIIATMALFYGVGYWNSYTPAIMYNHEEKYYPIQVIINRMYQNAVQKVMDEDRMDKQLATEAIKSATVVFATVPIVCVYPFLQKYFAKGIMVGSLKG